MSWHERCAVYDLNDFEDGEKAIVVFPNLSEISWFNGEVLRHWAITPNPGAAFFILVDEDPPTIQRSQPVVRTRSW